MKTIAITIDEPTLDAIDNFTAKDQVWRSRSEVIRYALKRYVMERSRADEEAHEREVFRRHRERLNREATALIEDQAKP